MIARQHPIVRPNGASLVELLVTIGVAAALLSAAIPAYVDFSVRNRIATYSNDFIAAINLARSEAIRRAVPVTICASNDNATCAGNWSDGWVVFANTDNDDPAQVDAGEPLIKVFPALSDNFALQGDMAVATQVTYGVDGAAQNVGVLAVCHQGDPRDARAIVVTRLRPRVARDTDGNKVPNIDDGADIAGCDQPSGP